MSKCFSHLNGYEVKDSQARHNIETLSNNMTKAQSDIQSLSNNMTKAQNDITNLQAGKKYIFIGDSYGEGVSAEGFITSWIDYLVQYLNLSSSDYYENAKAGYGFSRTGYKFITLIEELSETITNKESITDIIVCGGSNDQSYSGNLSTDIQAFMSYCKTNYPKAKVYIGMIGRPYSGDKSLYISVLEAYKKCGCYGAAYLNNVEYALLDLSFYSSDGHPNVNGQLSISDAIYSALTTGNAVCFYKRQVVNIEGVNSTLSNNTEIFQHAINDIVHICNNGRMSVVFNSPQSFTADALVQIASYNKGLIYGEAYNNNEICLPIKCYISGGNDVLAGRLVFKNLGVYIGFNGANMPVSITGFEIPPFTAVFNAMYC